MAREPANAVAPGVAAGVEESNIAEGDQRAGRERRRRTKIALVGWGRRRQQQAPAARALDLEHERAVPRLVLVKELGPIALVDDSRRDRGVARSDALPRDRLERDTRWGHDQHPRANAGLRQVPGRAAIPTEWCARCNERSRCALRQSARPIDPGAIGRPKQFEGASHGNYGALSPLASILTKRSVSSASWR